MTDHENIYAALLSFQKEMPTVAKGAENPHFGSAYADLPSISEAVVPLLNKHGIIYTCVSRESTDGKAWFVSTLHHVGSNTTIQAEIPLTGADPQKVGSAITYYRRYLLGMLTGVVTDKDDDGNLASQNAAKAAKANKPQILAAIAAATDRDTLNALWKEHALGAKGADPELKAAAVAKGDTLPFGPA